MRSSYKSEDVTLLLKDITGMVEPLPAEEREARIQGGVHYCEMLPLEYKPTAKYMEAYEEALEAYAQRTADGIARLSEGIYARKGRHGVIVSLARAGLPIGILIRHYLQQKYDVDLPHYGISIIRGKGIDHNGMKHLLERHDGKALQFVDGWIGKGAILSALRKDLEAYPQVSPDLAVVADPAHMTTLCGTHEDLLIPSSCLNCTVSGLVSRTFLREDLIGPTDFHGAAYYRDLEKEDLSYPFIEAIEAHFTYGFGPEEQPMMSGTPGIEEVRRLAQIYGIKDINLIKPGIGEATRVLLRRVPWKLVVDERRREDPALRHLFRLAEEKQVPVEYRPLQNYVAVGLIKQQADV